MHVNNTLSIRTISCLNTCRAFFFLKKTKQNWLTLWWNFEIPYIVKMSLGNIIDTLVTEKSNLHGFLIDVFTVIPWFWNFALVKLRQVKAISAGYAAEETCKHSTCYL